MNTSIVFARAIFFALSVLLVTLYTTANAPVGSFWLLRLGIGLGLGTLTGGLLLSLDLLLQRFNLRSLTTITLGLFFGLLLGQGIWSLTASSVITEPGMIAPLKTGIFLISAYLGVIVTLRGAEEFCVSLPFVRLQASEAPKRDILLDASILGDPRLIDLASSGLLDQLLILPRFLINELNKTLEDGDESLHGRARRSLETIKRLEALPHLHLRYNDTDMSRENDDLQPVVKLARLLGADVLTAEVSRVKAATVDSVRFINIHSLSNSLKPIMQCGEQMELKIQRPGKENRQGVGYLEDGTMVVVNGGGDFIGQTIRVQVLSVKHTASGRMIFCNAMETADGTSIGIPSPSVARINVPSPQNLQTGMKV